MTAPSHVRPAVPDPTSLRARATAILDANWTGASTVPSRLLYPHQWNWDTAFIALGRSRVDEVRARTELRSLLAAQWSNGKVPHIVFNPHVPPDAYFPGPSFWDSRRSPAAPRSIATSGLTQPPLQARVALEMHRRTRDPDASLAFLRAVAPALVRQHRYLMTDRDPFRIGLPVIVHPWESGLDNSPVWDRDLATLAIEPGSLPPYRRHDVDRVDPADRPSDAAYDAFVYLAIRYRDTDYDDRAIPDLPFVVAGPLFAAIHLWSIHALTEIAPLVGLDPRPFREDADRVHAALLERCWDEQDRRFYPYDLQAGHREPEETIVSFVPLLDPDLPAEHVEAICRDLESSCFHPTVEDHFVVPTYGLGEAGYDPRRYWRGPVWLNTNWLLWQGLRQHGRRALAEEVRRSSIALVARSGFFEYFEPIGGAGHGSPDFSWTAALLLDFLAEETPATV